MTEDEPINRISQERAGELTRTALTVLADAGTPMTWGDLFSEVSRRVTTTAWENTTTNGGKVRWQNAISWNSLGLVKAGWLLKQDGVWSVTDEGRKALDLSPKDFVRVADEKYDAWHAAQNSVKQGAPTKTPNAQDLEDLRSFVESAGSNVWWVNQGQTYSAELKGGYLWAPQTNKAGVGVAHHTDLLKVEPGDVIVHYASSALRAVSRVLEKALVTDRPGELPGGPWDKNGYMLRTDYHQFTAPIRIDFLPASIRIPSAGPFMVNGGVKQGYLFQLSRDFVDQLAGIGHATSQPTPNAGPLHVLLKWRKEAAADTIERHSSIAADKGAVWWGALGSRDRKALSAESMRRLQLQLESGVRTLAFLYNSSSVWEAHVVAVTDNPDEVDAERIPNYYTKEECKLFVLLDSFRQLDVTWPHEHLALASNPGQPIAQGALDNQTTPLLVELMASAPSGAQPEELLVGATEQSLSQAKVEIQDLTGRIAADGKAAIWWSYPLNQAAQTLLKTNPYLYVYVPAPTKQLMFRYRVAEFQTQPGLQGLECPWPLYAKADEVGKMAVGPNMNKTFKTWFLVDQAEELAEPISPDSLTTANGSRVEMSVLRNSFAIWKQKGGATDRPSSLAAALTGWKPAGLELSSGVLPGLLATIDAGRHVILTGPPGTGKTRLAEEFAKAASAVGFTSGYVMTTASSDWTTFDTLGGYMPDRDKPNRLRFERGIVLDAIATNRWLILDEINRADADKAFGALLTLLAGFETTISFRNDAGLRYRLRLGDGPDCGADEESGVFTIGRNWRVVATMNTRDKNSLYALSYAFMRRFSFVFVGIPEVAILSKIVAANVSDEGSSSYALKIAECCPGLLGPAILIDIGKFIAKHNDPVTGTINAITAYVIPQFEGLQPKVVADNLRRLRKQLSVGVDGLQEWSAAAGVLVGAAQEAADAPPVEESLPDLDA